MDTVGAHQQPCRQRARRRNVVHPARRPAHGAGHGRLEDPEQIGPGHPEHAAHRRRSPRMSGAVPQGHAAEPGAAERISGRTPSTARAACASGHMASEVSTGGTPGRCSWSVTSKRIGSRPAASARRRCRRRRW
ncbi:hypothetical protein [Arthrobacter sp. KBS0703]|uniref:hypothetical protein n=1 Tax=Arthrobacter sp. KBS0703 TaxID=1955698 RepID=UPI0028C39B93|nr:hypothetical protein [Arthrobacter sp. KBS0703]